MSVVQWIIVTTLALKFGPGLGEDCSDDEDSHIQSLLQVDSRLEAEAVVAKGAAQVAMTRAREAPLWMRMVGPCVVIGIIVLALLVELPSWDETVKKGGDAQPSFDGPAQRNLWRVQGGALKYVAKTPGRSVARGSPTRSDSSPALLNCANEKAVPLKRPVVPTAVRGFGFQSAQVHDVSFQPTQAPEKLQEIPEVPERGLTFREPLEDMSPRLRQSVDAVQLPSSMLGSLAVPMRLNEVLLRLNAEAQGMPCTERMPVIGEMVKAVAGTNIGDARFPEWNIPKSPFFIVSEVDDDGDFKLQDSNGLISGWKYRKEFVFLPPAMNLHDPHAAPLPTPPISARLRPQDQHPPPHFPTTHLFDTGKF